MVNERFEVIHPCQLARQTKVLELKKGSSIMEFKVIFPQLIGGMTP
jgi:hypothetical protein